MWVGGGGEWGREIGQGRQPIKGVFSSQLSLWTTGAHSCRGAIRYISK